MKSEREVDEWTQRAQDVEGNARASLAPAPLSLPFLSFPHAWQACFQCRRQLA
jgi:hypothetical protein